MKIKIYLKLFFNQIKQKEYAGYCLRLRHRNSPAQPSFHVKYYSNSNEPFILPVLQAQPVGIIQAESEPQAK